LVPDDVERDGLMRLAAKAADFQKTVSCIEASPSVDDGCAGAESPACAYS
jgi:hypothetical protein